MFFMAHKYMECSHLKLKHKEDYFRCKQSNLSNVIIERIIKLIYIRAVVCVVNFEFLLNNLFYRFIHKKHVF